MAKAKGSPKTGGRVKGTPNKQTVAVKAALDAAFEGMGGVKRLQEWAQLNPDEFYKLWVKMLPLQVANADDEEFKVTVIERVIIDNG